MKINEAFYLLRIASQTLGEVIYEKRVLKGQVVINGEIIAAFKVLDDAGNLKNLYYDDVLTELHKLPTTGNAKFEAEAPKNYFENLDELIRRHRFNPPIGFLIYDPSSENHQVPLYLQAAQLAEILVELGSKHTAESCTITSKTELDIPFNYSVDDLCALPQIDDMREKLIEAGEQTPESKRMLELYRSFFIQAVHDIVAPLPKSQRFSHLLENFSECIFRFNLAFRCFSDEANKAIERYEEKRAGMIGALNGVLGNIQTSIIGVPLAGLLALKEIKPQEGLSFQNIVVSIAVIVVGALLVALSFSQGKTLDAIGIQEKQLRDEIGDAGGKETKIGQLLESMSAHHSLINNLLIFVRIIIFIFMLVAVCTLLCCYGYPN